MRHTFSCHPVLIGVTDLFGLDTEEVPLPPPEHLHGSKDETLEGNVGSRLRDVEHPDEPDQNIRCHGDVIILWKKDRSAAMIPGLAVSLLLRVEVTGNPSSLASNRHEVGADPSRQVGPTKMCRMKPRPPN